MSSLRQDPPPFCTLNFGENLTPVNQAPNPSEFVEAGFEYLYDTIGNPTEVRGTRQETPASSVSRGNWCYGYDLVGRLRTARAGAPASGEAGCAAGTAASDLVTGTSYELTYAFAQGRLSSVTNPATEVSFSYPDSATRPHAAEALTLANPAATAVEGLPTPGLLSYDDLGRVKEWDPDRWRETTRTKYTYDVQGNLIKTDRHQTADDATYAYAHDGIRLARKTEAETVLYLGGQELVFDGSVLSARRTFSSPGGTPLAVEEGDGDEQTAPAWTWLGADLQGSVRLSKHAADGTSRMHAYYPYGGLIGNAAGLPGERGFLNKPRDPDGTVRLDHRMFDPGVNVLTTPDPLVAPEDPQMLNPYSYGRNNPLRFGDPTGLFIEDLVQSIVDAIESAVESMGEGPGEQSVPKPTLTESENNQVEALTDRYEDYGASREEARLRALREMLNYHNTSDTLRGVMCSEYPDECTGNQSMYEGLAEVSTVLGGVGLVRSLVHLGRGLLSRSAGRAVARTGTVWDDIVATQPFYAGSELPRSFTLAAGTRKVWVNGNGTKHIAEYLSGLASTGATRAQLNIATQAHLTSLRSAVGEATSGGIRYGRAIRGRGLGVRVRPCAISPEDYPSLSMRCLLDRSPMIRVVGEVDCSGSRVDGDEYIGVSVSWGSSPLRRPLYLRISGRHGGEIEIKADPSTGAFVELIVIIDPPNIRTRPIVSESVSTATGKVPVLDLASWTGATSDATRIAPVFVTHEFLGMWEGPGSQAVLFAPEPSTRQIVCDGVTVGVTASGELGFVAMRSSSKPDLLTSR